MGSHTLVVIVVAGVVGVYPYIVRVDSPSRSLLGKVGIVVVPPSQCLHSWIVVGTAVVGSTTTSIAIAAAIAAAAAVGRSELGPRPGSQRQNRCPDL